MKKRVKLLVIIAVIFLATSITTTFAQPNPGQQSNGSTTGGAPIAGSGAPIGSGEIFLLIMAAMYGGKRVYDFRERTVA